MKSFSLSFVVVSFLISGSAVSGQEAKPSETEKVAQQVNKIFLLSIAKEVQMEKDGITYSSPEWGHATGWSFEDGDGKWVLTAGHIVGRDPEEIKNISCVFRSGDQVPEELVLVGYDRLVDVALLKFVNPAVEKNLPVFELGESSSLRMGQAVTTLGHPQFITWVPTWGFISNPDFVPPTIGNLTGIHWIVHNCRVDFGNSGGPLLDQNCKVVGVNVQKADHSFGIAVPVDDIKRVLPLLKKGGEVRHPPINLVFNYSSFYTTPALMYFLGMSQRPDVEGLMVVAVRPGTLPEYAGFKVGDIVLSVDGQKPKDLLDLYKMIYFRTSPAEIAKIKIKRGGQELELPLVLVLSNFRNF